MVEEEVELLLVLQDQHQEKLLRSRRIRFSKHQYLEQHHNQYLCWWRQEEEVSIIAPVEIQEQVEQVEVEQVMQIMPAGGTAGTNTGGGGGGGGGPGSATSKSSGGTGGSGIVIVKELNKASGSWPLRAQFSSQKQGTWPEPQISFDVDYLVVAGGGGGGGVGGGGGAGGFRTSFPGGTKLTLTGVWFKFSYYNWSRWSWITK
jgi:hypothetical protein